MLQFIYLFIFIFLFLREILDWVQSREFPIPPVPHTYSIPFYQHLSPEWYIYYSWWTYIDTSLSPKVQFALVFTLGVMHSMSLTCLLTCIPHDSVIQNSFTALKVLCALSLHPSPHLHPQPLQPLVFLLSP